jgi:heat shock protein HslJ
MKKIISILAIVTVLAFASCASKPAPAPASVEETGATEEASTAVVEPAEAVPDIAIADQAWLLSEVRTTDNTNTVTRGDGQSDFYTITFDGGNISGKAAPNTFTGTYGSPKGGNSIVIKLGPATAMAALGQVPLSEADYFTYLGKVERWETVGSDSMILYGSTEEKAPDLVFVRAEAPDQGE